MAKKSEQRLKNGPTDKDIQGRFSVTFHLMFVHIILVRFRLLSDHLLGKSCMLTRLTICSLCILTICYFSYFPFWY